MWEHITDPEKIADWLMPNDFDANVGKEFSLGCIGKTIDNPAVLSYKIRHSCIMKNVGLAGTVVVPEPSTSGLMGSAMGIPALLRWRK